jgi:hypothetical protein
VKEQYLAKVSSMVILWVLILLPFI